MKSVKEKYDKRVNRYNSLTMKQTRMSNILGNSKLAAFLAGGGAVAYLYATGRFILATGIFLAAAILFAYLSVMHRRIIFNNKYADAVKRINEDSLKRLEGEWQGFRDNGSDFINQEHPYTQDLDIFGRGSLYQMVNTAGTFAGRNKLRGYLEEGCRDAMVVRERQKAVAELAVKLKWRQRFAAEAGAIKNKASDPDCLYRWSDDENRLLLKKGSVLFYRTLPVITILVFVLSFITQYIKWYIPVFMLAAHFLLLKLNRKERYEMFDLAEKYKGDLKVYNKMLKSFEKASFKSQHLVNLQKEMKNRDAAPAYIQIEKLERIVDSMSNRYNGYYFFFNLLTLWDYQCLIALQIWKEKSGRNLRTWLEALGEMEALSSLAIIAHDHPDWAYPDILSEKLLYSAKEMGHPLLPEGRVCNDLEIKQPGGILLITGSNMSGKSTLLRTAGINLVLAYAGAPVCAKEFRCSIMDMYSCMRVSDNLEKNISSFYAELLRIKMIVKAVERGRPVFFLLDEIFKGTNSLDRHTGAKMLITKLLEAGATGMVSTHDLELAVLEKESGGKIRNYHFREYYKNNEIMFDYKLRSGVSTTRNAMYLMRIAGIEPET